MIRRKLAILGSTGSIGTQALQVAQLHEDRFQVVALTANQNREKLFEQVRAFRPQVAGLVEPIPLEEIPQDLRFCDWVFGKEALTRAAACDCDDVLVSVVGMVGLESVLCAFAHHKRVLLANKEALVAGGHLVMEAARREGPNRLLPVDSEHSAIFQCLQGAGGNPYQSLVLTCSGGPFRTWDRQAIRSATRAQALKHPNWVMGQKITIDSATLFNKALEMMEARWLFDARPEQIQVVVHPQSVVHSGVTFADGALIAQLGTPDMRLPILYAMTYPERLPTGGQPLDLFSLSGLTFERPDEERFPSVRLSRECMQAGGAAGCVLNAANEEAVFHLLRSAQPVPIGRIFDTVEEVLSHVAHLPADTLDDVLAADRQARLAARQYLSRF
ncbi:MAG: 1-deoxy-D-xylulose-5-phosphate reductoisomerase [Candidatus Limiplasma sp.]|nr:1-deoxy-D-xylulose-5-phosphate reductoisomerase [Candidatus Limiplasma sp.]